MVRRARWWAIQLALVLFCALLTASNLRVHALAPVSVGSKIQVSYSGLVLNRATNTFDTLATLTNISTDTLGVPISLVIASITPSGVTLFNPTGTTTDGKPFITVLVPQGGLSPGGKITNILLKFSNPTRARFTFTHSVLANTPPVVNAGDDLNALTSMSVTLDGTASYDPDGDLITFHWSLVQAPGGSTASLTDPSSPNPQFTPDLAGDYIFELVVNDGHQNSPPDRMTVRAYAANAPPNARAGPDKTASIGALVTLDGSASDDPEQNPLSFSWSFVSIPPGSTLTNASLLQQTSPNAQFVPDIPGTYVLNLRVSDGALSDDDSVEISASNPNVGPNADAGPDQVAKLGEVVTLDGLRSFDPDTGPSPLSFLWIFVSRPAGSLLTNSAIFGATTATPSFTPDALGAYVLRLRVSDGDKSAEDNVFIQVVANQPPDAVDDVASTVEGTPVTINVLANDSDPDGDPLTVTSLTQPANGTAVQNADNTITYTANPTMLGTDSFTYTISDGRGGNDSATVRVTVNPRPNRPPVAVDDNAITTENTAADIPVLPNDSDPDGDTLAVTSVTQGTNGAVVINLNGTVTYTPNTNFVGADQFTYTIGDGRGGTAIGTVRVTVATCRAPTITSIDPLAGPVGTEVTITGTNLDCGTARTLTLNGIPLTITSLSATQIRTFIPVGAQDGLFSITTEGGTAVAPTAFDVLLSNDFSVAVAPSEGRVIQGSSSSYSVEIMSIGGQPFTGLAQLDVSGVPSGVTASFSPSTLTGGQRGMLTITAQPNAPLGSSQLTLRAMAPIDAQTVTKMTNMDLTILQGNRTALLGQFMLKDGPPMPGVKLSLISHVDGSILAQTTSDTGGNFLFLDPPVGVLTLSVDTTPFDPAKPYPIYGVDVTILAGTATVLPPFTVTPPPPPAAFVPINNAAQDQVITNPAVPGVSITLPAGATVTGWDGLVKTKITITRLTPDQLPVPPPPGPTRSLYQFNFGTNMGGLPSVPLPVSLPNDQGLNPGEKAEIWFYDAAPFVGVPGAWKMAGLGTVSQDGSVIVSDPGVGIDRFCGVCGTACIIQRDTTPVRNPDTTKGGDPVDLALGQMIEEKTDLVLPGRIPAVIHRTYNPFDPFGGVAGFELGLGPGWGLSVEVVLLEVTPSLLRLVLPGNARFDFAQQAVGSFVNTTHPRFAGAVLTAESGGVHRLRFKDGTVWRFDPHPNPNLAGTSLLAEQADRNGNRLTIARDGTGKITRLVEPAGRALAFTFTGNRITEISDPVGRTVRYSFNAGRLETVTNPAGGVTRYTYDSAGRILAITDPRGITYLTNEYDATGRVFRQTQADGGVWTFQYLGQPGATTGVIMTDPRGNSTTQKFNATAFASETTDATGQVTQFERDDKGQVISTTDPLDRITRFEYDGAGNVTRIIDPVGNARSFTYEPVFNRVTSITDPLGNVTQFAYDSLGNLTSITDPLGNVTQITYNQFGQPISTTDPLGNVTTFTYDSVGNLGTISDALGNTTRRTYDLVSRLIEQRDPRGKFARFTSDSLNRISNIFDALGGVTGFGYDGNGNLLTVTDARGNTTAHTYDSMDRLATRTDPVGAVESFQYDAAGNLIRHTDRKGQVNTFSYDPLSRRIGASYADGATTKFVYDSIGRLVQAADSAGGTILNSYDNLDRLIAQTASLGVIQYTYDALGRRRSMAVTGQPPVNYGYDQNSRLNQIVQGAQVVDLEYDVLGRRTKLTLPNNLSTEYRYDSASRLAELIYRNAFGFLGNLTYQYDSAGNRSSVGGSLARTLLPDPVATANYDAANRPHTFGDKTMTFDPNGNLTSITDPSVVTNLNWNVRNRLTALTGPGTTASFLYDPLGRRVIGQINSQLSEYIYDGVDIVQEMANGTPVNYLRSLNIDQPLLRNGTEHYLADALGSTIALTDPAGTVQSEYIYEPFGRTATTGASTNPFQYSGRERDPIGVYYHRARYYSPALHRFLSEDPLSFAGGDLNLYAYKLNSPPNYTDPLGLLSCNSVSRFLEYLGQGVNISGFLFGLASGSVVGADALDASGAFIGTVELGAQGVLAAPQLEAQLNLMGTLNDIFALVLAPNLAQRAVAFTSLTATAVSNLLTLGGLLVDQHMCAPALNRENYRHIDDWTRRIESQLERTVSLDKRRKLESLLTQLRHTRFRLAFP